MSFSSPTEKQARLLWAAITAIAVGILAALAGLGIWALAWVANRLSAVLLPLAVAAVIAYLLEPIVDFLERRRVTRSRAIFLGFTLGSVFALLLAISLVPRLVFEVGELIEKVPDYASMMNQNIGKWLAETPRGMKAKEFWDAHAANFQIWLTDALPIVGGWLLEKTGHFFSWFGLFLGFFLVPIYAFYFLKEKQEIESSWTDYLPMRESRLKEEFIFVVRAVNDSLIVFFRGQILVALCVAALTTLGFWLLGLNYSFVLGFMAGLFGVIPYMGVVCSLIPALLLAAVQFGDWQHPLLVIAVSALVHLAEGWVISPKIIGDRVGMHPMAIIIAIMIGTSLLGGIVGGVLAIPLTAALRTLMFRYVWKKRLDERSTV
ncbi:MAG: AI-2E family transporter [Verrucomicrobia bacterium]|nr:AI-2E family transporter [Verrucomicrobiota bacterium]